MDDAARVCGGERISDRESRSVAARSAASRGEESTRPGSCPRTYSITMKSRAVGRLDLVNRDDVGMIQRGGGMGFLHKSTPAVVVADTVRR